MKKWMALSLVLVMLLSMLAGCGSASGTSEAAASSGASAPAPAEEPSEAPEAEEAESAAEASEASAEAGSAEEASSEEAEPETPPAEPLELPICDDTVEFTYFIEACDQFQEYLTAWGDNVAYLEAEELTNVHVEFLEQPVQSFSEQFNLMVAAGDYTDFLKKVDSMYAGGISTAVADDVVLDLAPYINTVMPDYLEALEVDPTAYLGAFNEDGTAYQIISVLSDIVNTQGLFVRQDWLDELGMEAPETYDELFDVLTAFKTNYGCYYTYYLSASMQDLYLSGGFGTCGFSLSNNAAASHFYHDGETVKSALIEDSFKEYLEYLNKLHVNGLIDPDFYSVELSPPQLMGIYYGGDSGVFTQAVRDLADTELSLTPLRPIVKNKGDISGFASASDYSAGGEPISVTTNCEEPELACKYLDFWFTETGKELSNYGIEGESFEYNDDGSISYTDLVLNNPDGMPYRISSVFYKCQNFVRFNVVDVDFMSFNEKQNEALEIFSTAAVDEHDIPELVKLNEEESLADQTYLTDVETYAKEMTLGFVTGAVDFDQWDEYVQTLKDLGIEECIAAHQSAYSRYLERAAELG